MGSDHRTGVLANFGWPDVEQHFRVGRQRSGCGNVLSNWCNGASIMPSPGVTFMASSRIKVLCVDDHPLILDGIAREALRRGVIL
jgi:hypothetical protein